MSYDPSAIRSGAVFSDNPNYLAGWLCYINGIEVPIVGFTVEESVWEIPKFQIHLVPDPAVQRLGYEDRVLVSLFYLDNHIDVLHKEYRLLIDGEIAGYSYQSVAGQRVISYTCLAHINVFKSLYFFFMNTVDDIVAGQDPMVQSQGITQTGLFYPYSLFHQGLIAPANTGQAIGADGTPLNGRVFQNPEERFRQSTTSTGTDDPNNPQDDVIKAPFELVYNVIRGIIADTVPAERRSVPAMNFFARHVRKTRLHQRFVRLPILEDPAVLNNRLGVFPIFNAARNSEALAAMQRQSAGQVSNSASVWDMLQQVLQLVYMEIAMVPAAPCVQANLDGEILGPASEALVTRQVRPAATTNVPLPEANANVAAVNALAGPITADTVAGMVIDYLRSEHALAEESSPLGNNLPTEDQIRGAVSGAAQTPNITPERLIGTAAQWTRAWDGSNRGLPRIPANVLSGLGPALQTRLQGLRQLEQVQRTIQQQREQQQQAEQQRQQQIAVANQENNAPFGVDPLRPLRLAQYFVKPQFFFGIPPHCNVIFPSMLDNFSYTEDYFAQPTRLYVNDSVMTQALQARGAQREFMLHALTTAYPEEAEAVLHQAIGGSDDASGGSLVTQGTAGSTTTHTPTARDMNGRSLLIWPEEFYKGPVVSRMSLPRWFQFLQQMRQSSGTVDAPATRTGTPTTATTSPQPGTNSAANATSVPPITIPRAPPGPARPPGGTTVVPATRTVTTLGQMADAIARAWQQRVRTPIPPNVQRMLLAHAVHEGGAGESMWNYNFGGIKGASPERLTTNYRTGEGVRGGIRTQAFFRAYTTIDSGAQDFVNLITGRYRAAIAFAQVGDVAGYARVLKDLEYYTDSFEHYSASLQRRYNQMSPARVAQSPRRPSPILTYGAVVPSTSTTVNRTSVTQEPEQRTTERVSETTATTTGTVEQQPNTPTGNPASPPPVGQSTTTVQSPPIEENSDASFQQLFRLYAQYEYLRQRYAARNSGVLLRFNPYVVVGFPCFVFDSMRTQQHITAYVMSKTHSAFVNPGGQGTFDTQLGLSCVRTLPEFIQDVRNDCERFTERLVAAPAEIVEEIRHVVQNEDQAESFYQRLFYQNRPRPGGRAAAFVFTDALGYQQGRLAQTIRIETATDVTQTVANNVTPGTPETPTQQAERIPETREGIIERVTALLRQHGGAAGYQLSVGYGLEAHEARNASVPPDELVTLGIRRLEEADLSGAYTVNIPTAARAALARFRDQITTMTSAPRGPDAVSAATTTSTTTTTTRRTLINTLDPNLPLIPLPETDYAVAFDNFHLAMQMASRPICTLTEYIRFLHAGASLQALITAGIVEEGTADMSYGVVFDPVDITSNTLTGRFGAVAGATSSGADAAAAGAGLAPSSRPIERGTAVAYARIFKLRQGPGPQPSPQERGYEVAGTITAALPPTGVNSGYPQTRVNWDEILRSYRTRVRSRVAPGL